MSHNPNFDRFIDQILPDSLAGVRVMDVGHGLGQTGYNFKSLYAIDRGYPVLYGIEKYSRYHAVCVNNGIYDVLKLQDAADPWDYPPGYFGVSIAQEVLEHNPKHKALKIIENMEYYTNGLIIVTTPIGVDPSPAGRHGNPLSEHKSIWYRRDFTDLGFNTNNVMVAHTSKAVNWFAKFYYRLKGRDISGKVIAWKWVKGGK